MASVVMQNSVKVSALIIIAGLVLSVSAISMQEAYAIKENKNIKQIDWVSSLKNKIKNLFKLGKKTSADKQT
mgnify:CR=1 FL=1